MKRILAMLCAVMMLLSLCACGGTPAEEAATTEPAGTSAEIPLSDGIYIGVVYKQSGNAYFQAAVKGFEMAAAELGFTFEHDGPEDGSNDGQIRIIQNFIDKGVDVLCVSANDPDGLVDILQTARSQGIKVISWDAEVSAEARDLDVQPASAQAIAYQLISSISESLGGTGKIAIVSAGATAANQNLWISYIEDYLANDPAFAGHEYLGVVYGDDEYQKSYDVTLALLKQYPDLKGLIVPTTAGAPAVAKCVMDEGLAGQVKVTGLTLASDMAEYIKGGICDVTYLWNPISLGYVTSFAAVAMVKGELTGAVGDTLKVSGFVDMTVQEASGGGTILYLDVLNPFTADTVDSWVDIL